MADLKASLQWIVMECDFNEPECVPHPSTSWHWLSPDLALLHSMMICRRAEPSRTPSPTYCTVQSDAITFPPLEETEWATDWMLRVLLK